MNKHNTKLNVLCILQKRAVRIIANVSKYAHTNELFQTFSILKQRELVEYKKGIVMFNVYHGKVPNNLKLLFKTGKTSQYNTRQNKRFKVAYRRTDIKAFCISSFGCNLWNILPDNVIDAISIQVFKYKLKQHLLDRY